MRDVDSTLLTGLAALAAAIGGWLVSRRRYSGNTTTSDAGLLWEHLTAELHRKDIRIDTLEKRLDAEVKSWDIQRVELRKQLIESERRERECMATAASNNVELIKLRAEIAAMETRLGGTHDTGL